MDLEDNISTPCTVYWQTYPDPSSSRYAIIPFSIVYVILFFLGLFGNVTLIHVTCSNKTLLTVQNIFILNMAASDIMMCILSLPITPITNVYKNWYFGNILCHLIPCIQGISIFVCTLSLGAIALDRYILVVKPHTTPLSQHGAAIATVFLWILSFVVTLPYAFNMQIVEYNEEQICGYFCTEKWQSAKSRRAYTLIVMLAQFVLPFAVMAFCYYQIFAVLSRRAQTKIKKMNERSSALESSCGYTSTGNSNKTHFEKEMNTFLDKQEKEKQKVIYQNRRTTSILVTMVVWFGVTWLPHNVVSLIIEYDESQQLFRLYGKDEWDISYLLNLFTHCFAMSNNVVNPVLYAWLNPTFRQLVVNSFFGRRKKNERVVHKMTPSEEKNNESKPSHKTNKFKKIVKSSNNRKVDEDFQKSSAISMESYKCCEKEIANEKKMDFSTKNGQFQGDVIAFSVNETLLQTML